MELNDSDFTPNQVLVTEVEFFDDAAAKRLARWLNRHVSAGQAAKRGTHVIVFQYPP